MVAQKGTSRTTFRSLLGLAALAAAAPADKADTLRLLLDLVGHLHAGGTLAVARTCVTCRFFDRTAHDDPARPHHCRLLDTAFGDADLRLDCAEHQSAEPPRR